jgi:Leucine-rich repeat (LRR) protein
MENLTLPNLRELFLHRNRIEAIEGLQQCPKLRRLWLFQNNISSIMGLNALPELEECWIQGNQITTLLGIETISSLVSFAVSGNKIADFNEIHRLAGLNKLSALSLSDVHFGRCPIADDPAYKKFCICYLPQLSYLDGVQVTQDQQRMALSALSMEVSAYNDRMALVEEGIKAEIQSITIKQQASRSHLAVLEREMSEALKELEGLVSDGRAAMAKQAKKQKKIMESGFRNLERNISDQLSHNQVLINSATAVINTEHDISEALFNILERAMQAEIEVMNVIGSCSAISKPKQSPSGRPKQASPSGKSDKRYSLDDETQTDDTALLLFAHQPISDSSPGKIVMLL